MKREKVGCLAMLIIIPIILALMVSIWWCSGYVIIFCVNHLAQSQALPETHIAYLCAGLLLSVVSGAFKVSVKKD